jgi:hypothetical protein
VVRPEQVVWRTAEPLWPDALAGRAAFERPALLRLAGDDFMEQLLAALGAGALAPLVAGRETWRRPGAGLGTEHARRDADPVVLFQPTHERFYVVTGSLVCRRYGHPDHAVRADRGEQVAMVLRRLVPAGAAAVDADDATTYVEHGWVPAGTAGQWQPVPPGAAPDEERLPLFPLCCERAGRRRRMWAGLVPVSRREVYETPARVTPADVAGSDDPLAALADTRLQVLESVVVGLQMARAPESGPVPEPALLRESLFFTLVDLARWLDGPDGVLPGSLEDRSPVLEVLEETFAGPVTWRAALGTALANEAAAVFEPGHAEPEPVRGLTAEVITTAMTAVGVTGGLDVPATRERFFTDVQDALADADADAERGAACGDVGASRAAAVPADPGGPGVYVTRLLLERPRCAPAERLRLSAPSRSFRLAGFHDPDAPARPVRIVMPVDTSPGGLRRFPRNVSVVLSNELRRQLDRVTEDTLRTGDPADPSPISFGMVCQLSIPIISICALALLMVLVVILNIVFFWIPLFKVCLPVPEGE